MSENWPDQLIKPTSQEVAELLADFWSQLAELPGLIACDEYLLCAECVADIRSVLIRLVLALNGIARPGATLHLNTYLSSRQRGVLEKTLVTSAVNRDAWIGQAVAMVVIYRWYAPQLVGSYGVTYPESAEQDTLLRLSDLLPDWPRNITTD